ncbi:MAG: CIS tube protein [Candidatus Methanospirareceae archaeon]
MSCKKKNKACLVRKDKPSEKVDFLFNPSEFTVERTNQFKEVNIPGLPSSSFQFVKGGARTLTMEIFFDTYEEKVDVRTFTDRITGWESETKKEKGLMDIDSDLHAPPVCLFVWGSYIFPCIIERATKKFTMFHPDGFPVRARLNVTLKEYIEVVTQLKETSLQSADRTKRWQVKEGDSLWSIADAEYGDAAIWRPIADANDIDNPRLLEPGMELVIPPLE